MSPVVVVFANNDSSWFFEIKGRGDRLFVGFGSIDDENEPIIGFTGISVDDTPCNMGAGE